MVGQIFLSAILPGQEALSASLHGSRDCYNRYLLEMWDEQRKESEKAGSFERVFREFELDRSSDICNITTEFSISILLVDTQIKLIVYLLVGMLITHGNLTQSIASLLFSSVSTCICDVREYACSL